MSAAAVSAASVSAAAVRGVRDMYDRDAPAYAALRAPWLRPAGARAIAGLSLRGEPLVLDVACGAGAGLDEIARVAPPARLVGVDLSAQMLSLVDERHPVAQADAAALPFADDVADALLCCFALMHLPSPAAAAVEFARVLRPGGTVAVATWGPAAPWPVHAAVLAVLDELGAPAVASSHHGGAATDSPSKLEHLLANAGFGEITTSCARLAAPSPSVDVEATLLSWSSLGSTATRLRALDEAGHREYRRRALAILAEVDPADLVDPREVVYAWARTT